MKTKMIISLMPGALFLLLAIAASLGTAATVMAQTIAESTSIRNTQPTIFDPANTITPPIKTSILTGASEKEQAGTSFGGFFDMKMDDKFKTPVTETGVIRKAESVGDLRDWFSTFFSQEKVDEPIDAVASGFSALIFNAVINGKEQRGIAVDFGDLVMYHLTTDKAAGIEALAEAVGSRMEMVTQALTDLDPGNKDRCNCVLYVRNNFVPTLPAPLTTSTQKLNSINHYFPRIPSAAIHPISSGTFAANWHVSAVRSISINKSDGNLNLRIREANYPVCGIYERTGTPDQLGILGYYDPTYPATSSSRSDTNAPKLNSITNTSVPHGQEVEIVANGANFEASKSEIVIFGGWCDAWGKCVIPNSHLRQPTSTQLRIPLFMNNEGDYHVYVFNPTTGKTSNGKHIHVY